MEIEKKEFLNEYSWDEINWIAKNNLGKKYFKLWDFKIMEGSDGKLYECRIIGFDHDDKSDGSGKAGITFLSQTNEYFYHFGTHSYDAINSLFYNYKYPNGISWVGSDIRKECLKKDQERYIYIENLKNDEEYYFYNTESNQFEITSKIKGIKLYKKEITTENGKLYNLISADVMNNIVSVKKKTWTGYGGTVKNTSSAGSDNTIITTDDKLWILADGEVFGNSNRYNTSYIGKYELEGNQYEVFKEYNESIYRSTSEVWLRSSCQGNSTSFQYWNGGGYVSNYSANYSSYVPLCFCL